jgi:hypothetical protein
VSDDVYGARTIKKRGRRTKAEMEALRGALYQIRRRERTSDSRNISDLVGGPRLDKL